MKNWHSSKGLTLAWCLYLKAWILTFSTFSTCMCKKTRSFNSSLHWAFGTLKNGFACWDLSAGSLCNLRVHAWAFFWPPLNPFFSFAFQDLASVDAKRLVCIMEFPWEASSFVPTMKGNLSTKPALWSLDKQELRRLSAILAPGSADKGTVWQHLVYWKLGQNRNPDVFGEVDCITCKAIATLQSQCSNHTFCTDVWDTET